MPQVVFLSKGQGIKTTDYRLRTTDYGLRTTDYRLRTTDYRLRTTDYGLQTFVLRLLIDKRKIRNSVVPTVHRLCPTCCLVVSWTSSLKELRSSGSSLTAQKKVFVYMAEKL